MASVYYMGSGIITGSDEAFFTSTQILLRSIRAQSTIPVHVFDFGLSAEPITELDQQGITHSRLPHSIVESREQKLYAKPYCFVASPFDQPLWIDSDCVVLRNLEELFDHLARGPLVTRCDKRMALNHPQLYSLLPVPTVDTTPINAGVLGLNRQRDRDLLATWLYGCTAAMLRPDVAPFIQWQDQGALIWALNSTGMTGCITDHHRFNITVGKCRKRKYRCDDADLLNRLRRDYPSAAVVHWAGRGKLHERKLKA